MVKVFQLCYVLDVAIGIEDCTFKDKRNETQHGQLKIERYLAVSYVAS